MTYRRALTTYGISSIHISVTVGLMLSRRDKGLGDAGKSSLPLSPAGFASYVQGNVVDKLRRKGNHAIEL